MARPGKPAIFSHKANKKLFIGMIKHGPMGKESAKRTLGINLSLLYAQLGELERIKSSHPELYKKGLRHYKKVFADYQKISQQIRAQAPKTNAKTI